MTHTGNACKDHTGRSYGSIAEMCRAYKITAELYAIRLKMGWPIERALVEPVGSTLIAYDHKGVRYPNQKAMCAAYGVTQDAYKKRRDAGKSVEEALTTPMRDMKRKHIDARNDIIKATGESLEQIAKRTRHNAKAILRRVESGMSVESALKELDAASPRRRTYEDYAGRIFGNRITAAEFYCVSVAVMKPGIAISRSDGMIGFDAILSIISNKLHNERSVAIGDVTLSESLSGPYFLADIGDVEYVMHLGEIYKRREACLRDNQDERTTIRNEKIRTP